MDTGTDTGTDTERDTGGHVDLRVGHGDTWSRLAYRVKSARNKALEKKSGDNLLLSVRH
jgi:hypothetical protein